MIEINQEVGRRFAQHLRRLRKKRNLTQEQLAELADISVKHVQRLESDAPCGVRLVTLHSLAKALEVSLPKLVDF